ncbi:MAG: FkbM family methyltransferase [Alphaproteobacteria bacterium]|jgi:FkbM family methyltransferase|nr:FkbM family methyltransferase [Alphaproteobacteria bacterium]MBP9876892.1 FkbM family methyltransferase [Alphaproteobacteria bacterium]
MDVKKNTGTLFQSKCLQLLTEDFVLIDIGCSGGIDSIWHETFKGKLQAYGIDSNIAAIDDLNKKNTNSKIKYTEAMIACSSQQVSVGRVEEGFWDRTSAAVASEIAAKSVKEMNIDTVITNNLYQHIDAAQNVVTFKDYIDAHQIKSIDFIKIDIDGDDFNVLKSAEDIIRSQSCLGVVIEVNFYGEMNRFSEVDIFMRRLGFEICELRPRRYDSKVLPGRFEFAMTAQTNDGRIAYADALYLRDPCKEIINGSAVTLTVDQLLKLSMLYDVCSMSSWAVEILMSFKNVLEDAKINAEEFLDLLAQDASRRHSLSFLGSNPSYRKYIDAFKENYKLFFPRVSFRSSIPVPNFVKRAYRKVKYGRG